MSDLDLHTIVYMSEAIEPMRSEDLLAILQPARRNNRALDVTGLLLYRECRFVQVLEGPRRHVQRTYDVIKLDPRHRSLIKLVDQPASRRQFMEWSMAFTEISDELAETVPGFSFFLKNRYPADPGPEPGTLLEMLSGFRSFLN